MSLPKGVIFRNDGRKNKFVVNLGPKLMCTERTLYTLSKLEYKQLSYNYR